jgi:hypothetical protein
MLSSLYTCTLILSVHIGFARLIHDVLRGRICLRDDCHRFIPVNVYQSVLFVSNKRKRIITHPIFFSTCTLVESTKSISSFTLQLPMYPLSENRAPRSHPTRPSPLTEAPRAFLSLICEHELHGEGERHPVNPWMNMMFRKCVKE